MSDDKKHDSPRLNVESYKMDTGHLVPDVGAAPIALCHIDITGVSDEDGTKMTARLSFVETGIDSVPQLNPAKPNIKALMHCSMIPMVLAQLERGNCYVTFEDQPGTPVVYVRNDTP